MGRYYTKEQIKMFNICNLGISTEENIIYITNNVFIEMFKTENRFNYMKEWIADIIMELSNKYNNIQIKIKEE